jgi:hypothetical protein
MRIPPLQNEPIERRDHRGKRRAARLDLSAPDKLLKACIGVIVGGARGEVGKRHGGCINLVQCFSPRPWIAQRTQIFRVGRIDRFEVWILACNPSYEILRRPAFTMLGRRHDRQLGPLARGECGIEAIELHRDLFDPPPQIKWGRIICLNATKELRAASAASSSLA